MVTDELSIHRNLVDVAMGRTPASLVIHKGRWVCVQSGEILPNMDVAIWEERIAFIDSDASHTIGENTKVIDADGRYLVPGFLDGHMHIESGMLTVTEFVRAVIPHGTTGMFIDPHEIANVFGLKGVRLMVDEAAVQPIHVWVQMPSCVPSAPGLETPGAEIGPMDVAKAMTWEGVIGLGEVMNFPGVYLNDAKIDAEMAETRQAGKVIGGHYASPDLGLPFHGYVVGGPEDDHEGTRLEDGVARVRQGMKALLRQGSGWQDVAAQVKAITEMGMDPRHFLLCTDDVHSETLVYEGHVNRAVKIAIKEGVPPLTAIQMATINTAEHFGLARQVGMIAPGRYADLFLTSDLNQLVPELVIAKGKLLAENQRVVAAIPSYPYPDWVKHSVHLKGTLVRSDFHLSAPKRFAAGTQTLTANVIGIIENQAATRHLRLPVAVQQGEVKIDMQHDLAKLAIVERHAGTGRIQVGLVNGFGFNVPCAIASTVAHDSHHLLIVGTDEEDMALAGNELARIGGGQIVVREGKVIGLVELPIAGLMSDERAEFVAEKARHVLDGFRACGCTISNPNMQLSLLALVVIPELRLSDLGLVDVNRFGFIPVFEN
jgi:adenine deaminase